MRKIIYIYIFVLIFVKYSVKAQNKEPEQIIPDSVIISEEKKITRGDKLKAFSMLENVTILSREEVPDTITFNQHVATYPEGRSMSIGYLGNIYSPWISYLYFDRAPLRNEFVFANAYDKILYTPQTIRWYDTKIPFSFLRYNRNFDSQNAESVVSAKVGSNFSKKFNLTAELNYCDASGFYTNNRNKNVSYGLSGYYNGERYHAYAFWGHNDLIESESGGITNYEYISNPQKFANGRIDISSREVPVRITGGELFNHLKNNFGFLSHSFSFGYWHTEVKAKNDKNGKKINIENLLNGKDNQSIDSIKFDTIRSFVSFMDLSHTMTVINQWHKMISHDKSFDWEKLFGKAYLNKIPLNNNNNDNNPNAEGNATPRYAVLPNDSTSMFSITNTVALSLKEGFRPWVKFGLSAYVKSENSWINSIDAESNTYKNTDKYNSLLVGGRIDKNHGSGLNFNVLGEVGVLGKELGSIKIEGNVLGKIKLWKEDVSLNLSGLFLNKPVSSILQRFHTTFHYWDKDFDFIKKLQLGGSLSFEKLGLSFSAQTETLHNHIYWSANGNAEQYKKLMQILSFRVTEDVDLWNHLGILADVAYQKSTNDEIIPLPMISSRLNVFAHFFLARVLKVQIGVDSYWHTAFKAPRWNPSTMQFQIQNENNIGGKAPLMIAYANFKLKQGRFFVKMFNVGEYIFDPDRMSLDTYPYNPPHIEAGIVLDLFN